LAHQHQHQAGEDVAPPARPRSAAIRNGAGPEPSRAAPQASAWHASLTQQLLDALHLRSRTRSNACLGQRVLVVLEPAQHGGMAVNVSEECGGIGESPSPRQDHAKPTPSPRQRPSQRPSQRQGLRRQRGSSAAAPGAGVRGGATVLDGSAGRHSARHERSAGRPMNLTSAPHEPHISDPGYGSGVRPVSGAD
jgi:hypothetical protein